MKLSICIHPVLAQNNSGILPITSPYWIIFGLRSTFEGVDIQKNLICNILK